MLLLEYRAQFVLSNERCLVCLRENVTDEYIIEITPKISVLFELSQFLSQKAKKNNEIHFIFPCLYACKISDLSDQ